MSVNIDVNIWGLSFKIGSAQKEPVSGFSAIAIKPRRMKRIKPPSSSQRRQYREENPAPVSHAMPQANIGNKAEPLPDAPKRGRPKKKPKVSADGGQGIPAYELLDRPRLIKADSAIDREKYVPAVHPDVKVKKIDEGATCRKLSVALSEYGIEWMASSARGTENKTTFTLESFVAGATWATVAGALTDLSFKYNKTGTFSSQKTGEIVWTKTENERYFTKFRFNDSDPYRFTCVDQEGMIQAFTWNREKHCLVAGKTGSGKTVTAMAMIAQALHVYSKQKWGQVFILNVDADPKGVGLEVFENKDRVGLFSYGDDPHNSDTLLYLFMLMNDRAKIRSTDGKKREFEPITVVVDELDTLLQHHAQLTSILAAILKRGRKYGIFVILCSQDARATTISGKVRQCLGITICHAVASARAGDIILGPGQGHLKPHKLPDGGAVVVLTARESVTGQVPFYEP